jgi:hypothetical protein
MDGLRHISKFDDGDYGWGWNLFTSSSSQYDVLEINSSSDDSSPEIMTKKIQQSDLKSFTENTAGAIFQLIRCVGSAE